MKTYKANEQRIHFLQPDAFLGCVFGFPEVLPHHLKLWYAMTDNRLV